MAKLFPLCSGSGGNCTYIETSDGGILIDAGISFKMLETALRDKSIDFERIRAVAVTHTHSDHIKGLHTLLKKTNLSLVASSDTLKDLENNQIITENTRVFAADEGSVSFGDILINFFPTNHDTAGSGGYVITLPDGRRCGVCTDLGIVTAEVESALTGCDAVLVESNHDIEMLKRGPYPANLKIRILSDKGHLSNNACADFLPRLLQSGTKRFILGHLSLHNNMPTLARSAAKATLADIGACEGSDYALSVAKPGISEVTVF